MSFFISLLHRVNFSVYSKSVSLRPHPPPLAPPASLYKGWGRGSRRGLVPLRHAWRRRLATLTPPDMAQELGRESQPSVEVLDVRLE